MAEADPLDELLSRSSGSAPAALWRGFIAHSLLFYRQNNLRDINTLLAIGEGFSIGPSAHPSWRPGRTLPPAPARAPLGAHARHILRGLRRHERYWGSLRLSAEALSDFERAVAAKPESPWGHLLAGMAHEMHRRYVRAEACFEKAMDLRPSWSWPVLLRGISRWYMARFEDSVRDFERAAKLDPGSEWPLLFLARAKADLRDFSLVADLNRAIALAPRSGFALSWRGRAMFVLKKTPQALADLRRSIRLLPDYDRGYSWLGVSYAELGRWSQAEGLLRKAHDLNPYYPTTLYPLAQASMRLGQWAQAGRALQAAAAVDRHGVWVEHRINMSHPNPACRRSLVDLRRYLEERPRAAWAWAWAGQTELILQDYWKAIDSLDRSVELDPRDPWALMWRGEARRRLGDFGAALKDFEAALALSPKLSWALAGRGHCLLSLGRARAALAALNRSLRLQGRCAPALVWRAEAHFKAGRVERAVADWEAALEIRPHQRWIERRLAQARARLGDWAQAAGSLERLCRDGGARSSETWALLGAAYARQGRERRAVEALSRSLKLDPSQPVALLETACWWQRHGQPARARQVLAAAGRPGGRLPRLFAWEELEGLQDLTAGGGGDRRLSRARERLAAGDWKGAVEEASRVLEPTLDPLCAEALSLRWKALTRLSMPESA